MNEKDRQLQVINCVHAIKELQSLKAVCRTLGDDILDSLDNVDDLIEKKLIKISLMTHKDIHNIRQ